MLSLQKAISTGLLHHSQQSHRQLLYLWMLLIPIF